MKPYDFHFARAAFLVIALLTHGAADATGRVPTNGTSGTSSTNGKPPGTNGKAIPSKESASKETAGKETPGTFDIRWGDQPMTALRTTVPPGASARWCGSLHRGNAVSWEFDSAEPLEMSVQSLEARNITSFVKLDAVTSAKGELQVDADQRYCWIWTNNTPSLVALQARLRKGGR
jgi:hypothetical protein